MKISTREVFLLTLLFLMLLGGAYYLFFYTPNTNEISELQENIEGKNTAIEFASTMLLRAQTLSLEKEALEKEFADVEKYLHEDFNDAEILRRIEKIIKPHTDTMNMDFANRSTGTNETAGSSSVRSVRLNFSTTYNDLQGIIKAFEEADVANRIVDFSCDGNYSGSSGTGNERMNVNLSVDFLER